LKPDELRSRFIEAESSAEEAAIFDTAVAELKQMDERARKSGINPGNFPLDVKQLRNRFINASSPIDSAISFESIVFEIEQLEQRLPPEKGKSLPLTPRPILLQTHNPEELKNFVETLANERDLYRKKLEEAIAEHSKLKRLLEDLTRDRVANLSQAGQATKLKQELTLLKSQPVKERQALEQLSNDHEQLRRQALITQQERDQLKEQTQELSGEIEQFREMITQLALNQDSATSKQEKLLDENFTLKGDMFKQALSQLENLESRLARLKKTARGSEKR
jgi:chromosome segregation ATPase